MGLKELIQAFKKPDHIFFLLVVPAIIINLELGLAIWGLALAIDIIEHLRQHPTGVNREN
jgi:hypothetical protein